MTTPSAHTSEQTVFLVFLPVKPEARDEFRQMLTEISQHIAKSWNSSAPTFTKMPMTPIRSFFTRLGRAIARVWRSNSNGHIGRITNLYYPNS